MSINLKAIPNFEGYSIAAESGLVYSHKRNRFLVMAPNNRGYGRTEVCIQGVRRRIFNHIKVVEVHGDMNGRRIPDGTTSLRSLGLSIDHFDRDKLNPRRVNLVLMLHRENCKRCHASIDEESDFPIPDL